MQATSSERAQHASAGQLTRFLAGIKEKLDANGYQAVCDVLADTLTDRSSVEEPMQFGLELSHACAAVACSSPTCELCINSDSRPCESLLKAKYLLGDTLMPACGAPVSVKLVRVAPIGGHASPADIQTLPPFILQVRTHANTPAKQCSAYLMSPAFVWLSRHRLLVTFRAPPELSGALPPASTLRRRDS